VSEDHGQYGVRDVLVQKGRFITSLCNDEIIATPTVLGDQTSLTHLDAIMGELASRGLDLQGLSGQFKLVLIHFGADGAMTCELVIDYIKTLIEPLGNVIALDSSLCLMHALNRICADHAAGSRLKLNCVFSMTKLLYIGMALPTVRLHRLTRNCCFPSGWCVCSYQDQTQQLLAAAILGDVARAARLSWPTFQDRTLTTSAMQCCLRLFQTCRGFRWAARLRTMSRFTIGLYGFVSRTLRIMPRG
jgi:hypothetical protein